jgi:hypothetical protein
MKNLKKFFGALLIVSCLLLTLSSIEFNWSMINAGFINLTFIMHLMKIVSVALFIVVNKNILADYAACLALLFSGVKPANTAINHIFGKIDGIVGAVVPVLMLIAIVLVIVAMFYMAYKTNKMAVGKTLVVIISSISMIASILVGFLINALAESNGVTQVGVVAESLLAAFTTILMIIGFFLTREDLAKITIVISAFLTWWTIINEVLVSRFVDKLINIKSYTLKGILPIMMAMLAIELFRYGLKFIFDGCTTHAEDSEDEADPEEDN